MQLQLQAALRDLRRTWPQLLIADLLSLALTLIVATPLVALLLKLFLLTTQDEVLTDADIAAFLLHPIGLVALFVLGSVQLGVYLLQVGLVLVIGFGAHEDRRVTYADALRYVLARSTRFLRLAGKLFGHVLLLVAPFLAGVGGLYLWLLRAHDINYYLSARPSEFVLSLALAGVLLGVLAVLLLRSVADWLLALPLLLFTDASAAEAMRRSRELALPQRGRIVTFLACWFVSTALASAAASVLVGGLGRLLVPGLDRGWLLVALGLATTLLLTAAVNLAVHFVSESLLPLLVLRWLRDLAGSRPLQSAPAERGSLGESAAWRLPGKALLGGALALTILAVGGAYATARTLETDDGRRRAVVIAHRGASAAAPENTLAAFKQAAEQGADWIELDVQESADGVVVVSHDSDFMKQARVSTKVWEATADDLRDIDIGSWFAAEFADERVPTLLEVLEWAHGRIGVVVELKYYGHDVELEERVAELVEEADMVDRVMVMSLARPGLEKFAALRPTWELGLLNTASLGDLTSLDVDFLALNAAAATRRQIRIAHARGRKVYVWTVNDPVQMSVLLSRGADGLITDEPGLAREVLALREELSPIGRFLVWVAGETGLLRVPEQASAESDA